MLTYDLTARGRKTMYEYLYEAMKADILSGRLAAGEKLPSKRAFAGTYRSVSRRWKIPTSSCCWKAISGRRRREDILSIVWR